MSYTTVDAVAAMFPTFKRGIAQQAPSDTYIQNYIDATAGEIDAVLQRRFGEAINAAGSFAAWSAAFSSDITNVLERINRTGAAGELAEVFASLGNTSAAKLGKSYQEEYEGLLCELNAETTARKPLPQGGLYDKLFDPLAKTVTPRAQMGGVAGGEMPDDQDANDEALSNYFDKFGTRQE